MMKPISRSPKAKAANLQATLTQFRRAVYAAKSIRAGLTKARAQVPANYVPAIVAELLKDRALSGHIVINPFPTDFDRFTNHLRLTSIDPDREFLWTASVLRHYADQISHFAALKAEFEHAFISGDMDRAGAALDQVAQELGVSLWYLENKIQFIQLTQGLSAQKTFLETTISHPKIDIFAGLLGYYFSMRSEENYSFNEIAAEANDLLDGRGLGDYTLFHVLPYDHTEIVEPAGVVSWEECRPIVDRYLAFVSMSKLQVARHGAGASPNLTRAVKLLDPVRDRALSGLRRVLGILTPEQSERYSEGLARFDAYTEGRYEACLGGIEPSLELAARASAMTCLSLKSPSAEESLAKEIVACMSQVLLVGPSYSAARARLQKLCMTCPRHAVSEEIVAFLERTHDNIANGGEYTELDRFAALSGSGANPWHEDVLRSLGVPGNLLSKYPDSSSLQIRKALQLPIGDANQILDNLSIPVDRRTLYKGHVALRREAFTIAAEHYRQALGSDKPFVVNRASAYLCRALLANGEVEAALDVVVDHCLESPSAYRLYPLEQLIDQIKPNSRLAKTVAFSILLHIATRNISSKWERDISDTYESIMIGFECTRPSRLVSRIESIGRARLTYFLRHVCIPRVFDDTIDFSSVTEIDDERIAVCQHLIELDSIRKEEYAVEIKAITREANIYQALRKVESSKIFVDEPGIRSAVEATLKDAFERFQRLSKSPHLTYQVEKISKLIEDLLSDNPAIDLKNLKLPASERESLFANMLNEFTTQFAINPAYGLDTHLSTTIRHGSFEGHIRSPLAAQGLLVSKGEKEDTYVMPKRWETVLADATPDQIDEIRRALGKFTGRVQDQLATYLRELLHVRGVDTHTKGLFNFLVSRDERLELMRAVGDNAQYGEFVDRLFAFSWAGVERSLASVRNELHSGMLPAIDGAVNSLLNSTSHLANLDGYSQFRDAIINGRTNVQSAIETVSNWFRRPLDFSRDPFDFDIALDVARKQITNCYVQTSIIPAIAVKVPNKIAGRFLDGMVEILFILLQNIIRHSGYERSPQDVDFEATESSGTVLIKISNRVADWVNITDLQALATEAAGKYQRDSAMMLARQEGGSGLSKVWRIVEYDFSVQHKMALEVSVTDRRFTVKLWLSDITTTPELH